MTREMETTLGGERAFYATDGRTRTTTFECGRCGRKGTEYDFMLPMGWTEVLKWDLCQDCSLKLVRWIEGML